MQKGMHRVLRIKYISLRTEPKLSLPSARSIIIAIAVGYPNKLKGAPKKC